jgi:ComF family protein
MRTPASGPGETVQHQDALCHFCSEIPLQLDGLRSYAYHVDPLRRAIRQFKYESLRALAAPLGELLIQAWDALFPSHCVIDAIVPVPLHARRERNRGYNQAALLSHTLGQHLRIPVVEDALVRIRHTRPQVGLNVPQRQANLRGAFRSMSAGLAGGRVLLVDDVCTSGSTLEEAAAALREGGATTIWAYTLTRARQ